MEWNAYHFVGETLRDGSPVPADGVTLKHAGPLVLRKSGLHASRHVWQALEYAPGPILCRVYSGGEIVEPKDEDKLVSTERTIICRIDATDLLRAFARQCALDVIDLWEAPDVVRRYLETGDESIRETALEAAREARAAARAAAWAARESAWAAREALEAARAAAWARAREKQRQRFEAMVDQAFAAGGL